MKNLPEKIYLNLNMTPQEVVETKDKDFHEATKTWEITWSEECLSEHDPEYVRKDALIEKTAWSEEDERMFERIFLKSLRPQNTWKPSDEQLDALKYVAYHLMPDENYRKEMFSLYEELKKLKNDKVMEANELMVGDYLMRNGSPYRVIQVDGIVRDGWMIENGEEDCGEPIPITPEILEKNGWEKRPTGYVFYTDGKRYDNSLWYILDSNTFVVNTAEFQIKYVHQLQHALRLCGIKKEIEL